MKTGFNKFLLAFALLTTAEAAFAMPGSIIAGYFFTAGTIAFAVTAFAVNMVASMIISKALANDNSQGAAGDSPNPGNRQQLPPATDNKLPVVYGQAWLGGAVTDLSITENNQTIYYVLALSEVTNYGNDTITFGDVYWGGKKCIFDATNKYVVNALYDESTNVTDTAVKGLIEIYLYKNGSAAPTNSSVNAITLMQSPGLIYKWDASKTMTNCAFAIIKLKYNQEAGVTGLQQTKFKLTNSRTKPGDCFYDYMTNTVYGAAIPASQIDSASMTALNTYCDGTFSYVTRESGPGTQPRFRFDGAIDTNQTIMRNLQMMASSCDCLLKYNEILGVWGVVTQKPTYTVAMAINDSNMVSAISISPMDIASTFNIVESKFPDKDDKDAFNTATLDLAQVAPSLLTPNEPVNKQTLSLSLVNNNVRAQYISTRLLKAARDDLQVMVDVNFVGLQLEAGDIVTVTSPNYGWDAKLFRVNRVTDQFGDDGSIVAKLALGEFNPTVYDDVSITEFQPSPNTGIYSPTSFGTVPVPIIGTQYPYAPQPGFNIYITASSNGIIQYAELWYSAFQTPTPSQMIFAGTTAIQSDGTPYEPGQALPPIYFEPPAGNWYFFCRMVNGLASSQFSLASLVANWRPTTTQYENRYINVRYGTSSTGAGFSTNPRGKTYYGLQNTTTTTGSVNPADYVWFAGNFGTDNYLLFTNRSNRKFSFSVGNAGFANLGGAFVPTETSVYDPSIWGALQDGQNTIDLDARTGQLIQAGTTTISSADGLLAVSNNTNGAMVVSLQKFLNFGNGVYQKTFDAATLTIDIYGRVVGFTQPDAFYFTETVVAATAGQTVFNIAHTVGNVLVFHEGLLVPTSDYTETSTTITINNAATAGEIFVFLNMRAVSTSAYYEILGTTITSSTSNTIVYNELPYQYITAGDALCFASEQPDSTAIVTTYTVQSVNLTTKTVTFTTAISGATAGLGVFRFRAEGATYKPFSRYTVDVTGATSITPTNIGIQNGFESIYLNGVQFNEIDYDLSGSSITGLPATVTGKLDVILFSANNFNVPASNITNTTAYSVAGASTYSFSSNPAAMEVYANGCMLVKGSGYDYTVSSSNYNLTQPIQNNYTLLNQQTFASMGAA